MENKILLDTKGLKGIENIIKLSSENENDVNELSQDNLESEQREFIVALSSTVDTNNRAIREVFALANNINEKYIDDLAYLSKKAGEIVRQSIIPSVAISAIDSVGYWEGRVQPDSFLIEMTRENAETYVELANELLGQDSILAFGPDCTFEVFDNPEDYCTLVGTKWIRFNFDGEVLETPVKLIKENKISVDENFNEDDIISIVYKVAKNIFYKRNWSGTGITVEDFEQEAAMYILNKYREGYFKNRTHKDIAGAIIGTLNNFFVRNMHQTSTEYTTSEYYKGQETNKEDIEARDDGVSIEDKGTSKLAAAYVSSEESPSDYAEREIMAAEGKEIVDKLLDSLNKDPYKTYKHAYTGIVDGKEVEMSEYIIAKLFLEGYTHKEIADIFTTFEEEHDYYSHTSRGSYVQKRVKDIIYYLSNNLNALEDDKLEKVKVYIRGKL